MVVGLGLAFVTWPRSRPAPFSASHFPVSTDLDNKPAGRYLPCFMWKDLSSVREPHCDLPLQETQRPFRHKQSADLQSVADLSKSAHLRSAHL